MDDLPLYGSNKKTRDFSEFDQEDLPLYTPKKEEPSFGAKAKQGLKNAAKGLADAVDTTATLASIYHPMSLVAGLGSNKSHADITKERFDALQERKKGYADYYKGDVDPGILGNVVGGLPLLPAQMATLGAGVLNTGAQFVEKGETLPKAYGAMGTDAAFQLAGLYLGPAKNASKPVKAAILAGLNTAQDVASRKAISSIADLEDTKETFAPTWESAAQSALIGAGFGLAQKGGKKSRPTPALDNLETTLKAKEALKQTAKQQSGAELPNPWEATVRSLGGEIPPKETPFSSMVDTLQGNPRVIDPEFKMAPDPDPYVKGKAEASADDALVARLQAAVDRQNPQQPTMRVTPEGQGFVNDRGVEAGRSAAEFELAQVKQQRAQLEAQFRSLQEGIQPIQDAAKHAAAMQRYAEAQKVFQDRQAALEAEVARRSNSDQMGMTPEAQARSRAQMEQAPIPGMERVRGLQAFDDAMARQKDHETSVSQLQDLNNRGQQMSIVEDFGNNDPMSRMPNMRIDENGMPIRADLSMEAQNLQDPLQRNLWGDELPVRTGDGGLPLTQALDKMPPGPARDQAIAMLSGQAPNPAALTDKVNSILKRNQGGSSQMLTDIAHAIVDSGAWLKTKLSGKPVEKTDSVEHPTSPDTISQKAVKRAKATAIGLKNSVYDQITTVEEAMASLGKDMSFVNQELRAGINAVIRTNSTNGPLKAVRYWMNKASDSANAYLKQYVNGNEGYNLSYEKLRGEETLIANRVIKHLADTKTDFTRAYGEELGLPSKVIDFLEVRHKALGALKEWGDKVNDQKGIERSKYEGGYRPSLWDNNFVAMVGDYQVDSSGKRTFVPTAVVGVKSRAEFNQALKHYDGQTVLKLGKDGRTGLRTEGSRYKSFDDVMYLLSEMAKHDQRFADLKESLTSMQGERNKDFMNFGVHELAKKGVEGFLGDKPWQTPEVNAKEALEAEVRYMDQASKYWASQELLDKTNELVTRLKEDGGHKNTVDYLNKYLNHLTGKQVLPTAAAINSMVDTTSKGIGHVANLLGVKYNENVYNHLRAIGTVQNAILMNVFNVGMFAVQSTQLLSSGLPEAHRVAGEYGISHDAPIRSMGQAFTWHSLLSGADRFGVRDKLQPPAHIKEGWEWMRSHGMDDFNEVMLSQDVMQSNSMRKVKQYAFWPTTIPEKMTRPTMFLTMVDMFHKAGYAGQDLMMRAKQATDYAMTDYRQEEAPLVYDRMGVLSPETSALQKYKHNALDQWTGRGLEAGQKPVAFGTMLGAQLALGGLLGLPALQELDELVIKPLTGKSARELMEEALGDSTLIDGLASNYSNLDLASRFALADVAPNSVGEAIAGARLSKLWKQIGAAYDFGVKQDTGTLKALGLEITPSGLREAYKDRFLTTEEGYQVDTKLGAKKYDEPRTDKERLKSNIYGIRPLREKQQDERNWTGTQRELKLKKITTDANKDMERALNFGDEAAFDKFLNKYIESGGDPTRLNRTLQKHILDVEFSKRARLQGKPGSNASTIRRFQEFEE